MKMRCFLIFLLVVTFLQSAGAGWRTELNIGRPDHSLRLHTETKDYRYLSDPSLNWKIKFGYGPLKISYGEPIKNTKISGRSVPGADYSDFEVRLYLNNFLAEYIYSRYQGFFTEDENIQNCTDCSIRSDLISRERTYQFFYALNPDFEIKKVISVADNGLSEIEFSIILIGGGNRSKLSDTGGIFRGDVASANSDLENLQEIHFNHFYLGAGAGMILPLNSSLHFSTLLSAATGPLEYNFQYLNGEQFQSKSKFGNSFNLKANLGTYGPGWNGGIRGTFLSNQYNMVNDKSLLSINYDLLIYLSYSF